MKSQNRLFASYDGVTVAPQSTVEESQLIAVAEQCQRMPCVLIIAELNGAYVLAHDAPTVRRALGWAPRDPRLTPLGMYLEPREKDAAVRALVANGQRVALLEEVGEYLTPTIATDTMS